MSSSVLTIQSKVQKETSHFGIPHGVIDVASLPAFLTNWGNFKTALDGIVIGVIKHEVIKIYDEELDSSLPGNLARRELKMLVSYSGDVTGDEFQMEIACPDLGALTFETGDANYITLADAGVMAAFVTAFEALVTSPNDDTEACSLLNVQIKGRNI